MLRTLVILLTGSLLVAACLAEGPVFDAASVKQLAPDLPKVALFSGGPGSDDPARIHLRVNMSLLLGAAFGVPVDQIKGPAWTRDFSAMPFYEIIATMPADSSKKQVEKMLRNLLVERFHMVFHNETQNFPGYQLVVDIDKGGPKLKESPPDFTAAAGARITGWSPSSAYQQRKFQEYTMDQFAASLPFLIGRAQGKTLDDGFFQPRVANKTGLTGKYAFTLEYNCPACAPLDATPPTQDAAPAAGDLFVAIQKQLGLRLIKTADVPTDVIVIEALDKTPTAN